MHCISSNLIFCFCNYVGLPFVHIPPQKCWKASRMWYCSQGWPPHCRILREGQTAMICILPAGLEDTLEDLQELQFYSLHFQQLKSNYISRLSWWLHLQRNQAHFWRCMSSFRNGQSAMIELPRCYRSPECGNPEMGELLYPARQKENDEEHDITFTLWCHWIESAGGLASTLHSKYTSWPSSIMPIFRGLPSIMEAEGASVRISNFKLNSM